MQTQINQSITGEIFAYLPIGRAELIQGEIIEMPPPSYMHGFIELNIASLLRHFVRKHNLGYVFTGEAGLYTKRNPDTVRGVDAMYLSHQRFAQIKSPTYVDVAPELVVEVLSPSDRWREVHDKLAEYFAIGVPLVWVINSSKRQVHVYRSLTELEILSEGDTLTGGDILAGFEVLVDEIFE